jgi:hypothetical protein
MVWTKPELGDGQEQQAVGSLQPTAPKGQQQQCGTQNVQDNDKNGYQPS